MCPCKTGWREAAQQRDDASLFAKCTLKMPHLSPINTNGVAVDPPSLPPLLVLALVPLPPPASGAALGPVERTWALGAGGAGAGAGATASSCAGTCCSKPPSSTPHSASVRPGSRALPYNMRHVPPRLGSSALTLAVNTWRGSGTHLRADSDKSVFSRRWRPVTKITQTHTSTTSPGSTSTVTRASVSVRTDTRMLGKTRLLFVE
jgi:hypothetical protein